MTGHCILPNKQEGTMLCFVVLFQARNMVQKISLGFIPFLLLAEAAPGILSPLHWSGCHYAA